MDKTIKRWVGFYRLFEGCALIGIGIGWGSTKPKTPCLLVQLGFWYLIIGPHLKEVANDA